MGKSMVFHGVGTNDNSINLEFEHPRMPKYGKMGTLTLCISKM